jgi:hypothetical protein
LKNETERIRKLRENEPRRITPPAQRTILNANISANLNFEFRV